MGTETTVYSSESSFDRFPRLLKNLKKASIKSATFEENIRTRIESVNFLDQGSCEGTTDLTSCGGSALEGQCKRVNEEDTQNSRMKCVCNTGYLGDFCQLDSAIATNYVAIVSEILRKIGKYLN